jgi:MFS family permease
MTCISYFNVANGLALSLGALIGGYLASHLPPWHNSSILVLFVLSGLLRAIVAVTVSFKEVRRTKETNLGKISSSDGNIPIELKDSVLRLTRKLNIFLKNKFASGKLSPSGKSCAKGTIEIDLFNKAPNFAASLQMNLFNSPFILQFYRKYVAYDIKPSNLERSPPLSSP